MGIPGLSALDVVGGLGEVPPGVALSCVGPSPVRGEAYLWRCHGPADAPREDGARAEYRVEVIGDDPRTVLSVTASAYRASDEEAAEFLAYVGGSRSRTRARSTPRSGHGTASPRAAQPSPTAPRLSSTATRGPGSSKSRRRASEHTHAVRYLRRPSRLPGRRSSTPSAPFSRRRPAGRGSATRGVLYLENGTEAMTPPKTCEAGTDHLE